MSGSIYRGRLYTNDEIKGPFTEAADYFTPATFNTLLASAYSALLDSNLENYPNISVSIHNVGKKTVLMFTLVGCWLSVDSEGIVEVGEGAA